MTDVPAFDICGPVPLGSTTLLEASAGTGKTWTIGSLVARYVAEGHARLEEILTVTFGRAASQELRERVRAQLVELDTALADPSAWAGDNRVVDLLLRGDEATLGERHARIREALASYDAATIATTHQFCAMVLDSLGVAGDTDPRARLVEDLDDLVNEVVDDLYLRAFALTDAPPEFSRSEALDIARIAVGDPQARLEPEREDRSRGPGRKVGFAHAVRREMERRKRLLGILSYDDLLGQLADALTEADSAARQRMRQRWKIVLVDEFQDTDPVQWEVLDRAFSGHATMVLIGDPKQAIYAFRGGDVVTYLKAAETAESRQTLAVNWRSDQALVDGLAALFDGAALGSPEIRVRPVRAHHPGTRLAGLPRAASVRLRVVRRELFGAPGHSLPSVKAVRPVIARDLAADIRSVLDSGATFDGQPLEARHIAVIANRHDDLAAAREALHEVGIPAVVAGGGSVFGTPAAGEWLTLLEAIEQPHRVNRVRAAALTSFIGHTATELDAGGDELTDRLADQVRDWAELFARRGVAAVVEAAAAAGLAERVLSLADGERLLTDLRHIGEVLHETVVREGLGAVALTSWVRQQVVEARANRGTERTRRLDSDAAAVQLVTIHASKGLEYPVVYLPTLADRHVFNDPKFPLFHDDDGARCRNVAAGGGAGWSDDASRAQAEEAGETLRLLYVAATRAQSQVVLWWAPTKNAGPAPLHRMIFGRTPGSPQVPDRCDVPTDEQVVDLLARLRDDGGPSPEAAVVPRVTPVPVGAEPPVLTARAFTRRVDETWRRTSYSSLTAVELGAPPVTVDSEPEDPPRDDEEPPLVVSAPPGGLAGDLPSPMASLPVGATFGSLVHAVLEHTDPEAPERGGDLAAEIRHHLDEALARWPVAGLDPEILVEALVRVCDSPLGPLTGNATLRRLPLRDRLRELEFELPMAGGDDRHHPPDPVFLGQVAHLLRRHLPEGDPVRAYAATLDHPVLGGQRLWGYLTGSIDVALRVGGRYLVVDYKTNWLGAWGEGARELSALDYRPDALDAAMGHSDYPLQALLYSLVLHRFLRWRLPGYDPDTHLGGVLYLYLRGMCGADTPVVGGHPCGVFSWRPPAALVEDLSDLFDGILR